MIEQIGESLEFRAHFTASKLGVTGLTVTVDVWGPAHTEIVTAGSATELGDGLYYYVLSSGLVTAAGLYTIVFKTTDATVDQQHLPANFTVGSDWVERVDTAVSTRATPAQVNAEADQALADYDPPTYVELDAIATAILAAISGLNNIDAAAVWSHVTRTLTSGGGASAADVWSYVTRTLTANVGGVTVVSAVSGSTITVYEYATWAFTMTNSALALADYENLIFAVKNRDGDTDDEAVLLVDITTGLKRIGRAAPAAANLGSLVKDSATSFTVLVAMSEVAAKIGSEYAGSQSWQLKGIDTGDDPDQGFVLIEGNFVIRGGKARAIV